MSGGDLDVVGGDESEVEGVAKPLAPSGEDHQLMAELSDVPPAQLLDGGSEDMDMVRGRGWGGRGQTDMSGWSLYLDLYVF